MSPQDPFGSDSEYLSPPVARRVGPDGPSEPDSPRRRLPLLLLAVLVLVLVESVIVLVNHRAGTARRTDAGPPTPSPTISSPTVAGSSPEPEVLGPPVWVTTTLAWVPPAGLTGGWDLFGRGPGVVVRLSPATGTVSRTAVPALGSSGPVSFVATPDSALVRPLDQVAGYVLPDGVNAHIMGSALASAGPMLPGPDPSHVWVLSPDDAHPALVLRAVGGGADGARLPIPEGASPIGAMPDGGGFALFATDHGLVDVRPAGARVVSRGTLLATGTRFWLVRECGPATRCTSVLIDQASLARADIGVQTPADATGAISPDGRFAAIVHTASTGGPPAVNLVSLTSLAGRVLPLAAAGGTALGTLAWSPDSRWLFVVLAHDGGLAVVDAPTGTVQDLGVQLPPLEQLAIRPAP